MAINTVPTNRRWAWWGVAAGVSGIVANLVADDQSALSDAERASGTAVLEHLERSTYQLGVVAGLVACLCLLMTAAGWRRLRPDGEGTLASSAVSSALLVSAAAALVGYGFRGGLAEYLPGGINEDNFSPDGVYVLFMINDTAPWFAWWGVVFAAGLCAWLSLRDRQLPLWLGVFSALVVVLPTAVMVSTGAVAVAGAVGPLWMVVCFTTVALRSPG